MSGVRIDVEARTSKAEQDLAAINASLRNIEKTTNQTGASLKNMFASLGALATAGLAVNYIKNVSTEFTNLSNKIATVTGRTKELVQTQEALFKIAEDTRGSLQGTVTTFASFGRALKSTGASTDKILQATKSVQQAIAISGSSAESAAGALIQLGQGIASGTLRGEELNSVLEQTPRIAQAIADELNTSVGKLRLIAADGKLTSDVVFNALLNQSKAINKEFGDLRPTLAQANSLLSDSIKIYVSELDKGLGLSESLGASTFGFAKRIKEASQNAFELGANISYSFNRVTGGIKSIGGPILSTFKELGKQVAQIIPSVAFSRTLKKDLQESFMAFDKFTGGLFTSINRFKFVDLISIESDVEEAIKNLKRLSPTYWAGAGFNRATFERFFSRETLNSYAGAFQDLFKAVAGNTNAIGGQLTKFFKQLDTGFKNIGRYFGLRLDTVFVFTGGNLENFIGTLGEIVRGLSGVAIKFYEVGRLAEYYLAPSIKALTSALKDSLPAITKSIGVAIVLAMRGIYEFVKAVYGIIYDFSTSFSIKGALETAYESVLDFFDGIRSKSNLEKAYQNIKDFGRKVIEVFFQIYDKVIGNSWWTDTVEDIIDTSNALWDKASAGLNKFKNNTIGLFKNIFDSKRRLNFDFSDIKAIDFSFTSFKLPKLETKDWTEGFLKFAESAKLILADLAESFPSIFKFALVAGSGLLISALFPAGVIKNVLLAAIITSLTASSTLIAEQFGAALTGGSFVSELGYQLGKAAGFLVSTLIEELPQFLNALLGIVSSFVRGFAEQLPLIGSLIKGIFNVGDVVGVSGPLGLLGAFLFGGVAAKTLKFLGIGKDAIEGIEGIFGKIGKVITGKDDGIISKFLFGKLGSARALSIIGLLLNSLGAFDAIFSHSVLAQYALQGGLIYTTLFGQAGVNKIVDAVGSKVLAPITDALKNSAKTATANSTLYDIFFGQTGTWAERASVALKSVLDKITGKVVDAATPFVSKGYDFVKTLLLGTKPEVTVNAVKKQVAAVATAATIQLSILKQKLGELSLPSFLGGFSTKAFGGFRDSVRQTASTVASESSKLSGIAAKVGGETGLLGRMMFGKAGKVVLIAGIVSLFATAASAAENAAPKLKDQSVFQDMIDNWNKIKLENPFAATALQIIGISIPLIIGALIFFRQRVISLISSAFDISKVTSWASTTVSSIGKVAASMKNIGIIGGAGALAGGLTYALTKDAGIAIAAATFAAEVALIFRKNIAAALIAAFQFVFVRLGGAILGFVFSIKGAIILLLTSAITAFIDWFFGLNLSAKIKDAVNKIKGALGFDVRKKSKVTGLEAGTEDFARSRKLPLTYSLEGINFKNISSKDSEKLQGIISKLNETIVQSIDEEERTGRVSQDTRDSIAALDRSLNNLIPKIEARSAFNTEDFIKELQELQNLQPVTTAQRVITGAQQFGLDIAFQVNQALIRARRALATTPKGKLRATEDLDKLRSEENTRYNARFRPLDPNAEEIGRLAQKVKSLEFPDAELAKQITDLEQGYLKAFKAVSDAEINIFGFSTPLSKDDPRVQQRDLLGEQLKNASLKQIGIDQANRDIQDFQNRLGAVATNLKAIGADFKSDELFAIDDKSFANIERLSNSAKELAEQLVKTKNIAEQNQIIYRITEIKTQVLEFKLRSEEGGTQRKQFLLKERLERAGIGIFSKETLEGLSDDVSENLFKLANDVVIAEENLKRKLPGPMQSLKPGDDSWLGTIRRFFGGKEVTQAQQEAYDSYEQARKNVQQAIGNLRNTVTNEARKTAGSNISVLKDLAASVNIDFNDLVKNKGLNVATIGINKLVRLNEDLEKATREGRGAVVESLTKQIERLKEDLQEAPKTLQDLISNISSLGSSISLEDLKLLNPEQLSILQDVSAAVNLIEKDLKHLGERASKVEIDKIIARKLAASQKAFGVYINLLYASGEKVLQALSKFGISDLFDVNNLTSDIISQFLVIDTEIVKLQDKLKDPNNAARFKEIVGELVDAQKKAEKLKNTFANFDVRVDAINKAFGVNLTDREAARLGDSLIIKLSDEAKKLLSGIEELKKLPMSGSQPINNTVQVYAIPNRTGPSVLKETIDYPGTTAVQGDVTNRLLDSFDQLRQRSLEVSRSAEVLRIKYLEAASEIALMPIDDLVSKITDAFPALADYKDLLAQVNRRELDRLGLLALDANSAKTNRNLGIGTQFAVENTQRRGTIAGQTAISALSFGAGTLSRLKSLGIEVDQAAYNLVSNANDQLIRSLTTQLEAATDTRNEIQKDPGASAFIRKAAQNAVNAARERLDEAIATATIDVRKQTSEAGKAFASSITSSWSSALTDYLTGNASWRDTTKAILDSFANQVIKTFIEGLTSPFTGENGILTQALRGLGSKIFSLGGSALSNLGFGGGGASATPSVGVTANAASDESTGLLSGILGSLTSGIASIGGFFGTLISGVASLFGIALTEQVSEQAKLAYYGSWLFALQTTLITGFGTVSSLLTSLLAVSSVPFFASGGLVKGPGTGTSDSITAQLSNGEFVVNAKATKRFLPLLAGINKGMIPKFAAGGLVSASLMASPSMADIKPAELSSKGQSQQTININVTGDVSRQTRAEIQRMIPNIATSINSYNREKG